MNLSFKNENLDRLETDPDFDAGYGQAIVKAFRKRLQQIRSAADERDFYAINSLNFERLEGRRSHQYSMRLNKQWRLILEFNGEGPSKVVLVIGIEDYH